MWFKDWFNEDYLHLYAYRSVEEAKEHVEFISKQLHLKGTERILDLACGTGRHSVAFGAKGHPVIGIDLSETLIKQAHERLQDNDILVTFQIADLFHLPEIGLFDLVVNLFTSFGYFEEDSRNQEVFHIVHNHLHDTGAFFLDYLHPIHVRNSLIAQEELMVQGEPVTIQRRIEEGIVVKEIHFPGRSYCEKVKLYSKDQIIEMLNNANLEVMNIWNDYEGNPWEEEGNRQLFLCKKKGG